MAEEGGSTSIAAPAAPAETPSMVVPEGGLTAPLAEKADVVDKRGPLFGDEVILSEAELTGEETADVAGDTAAAPGTKEAVTPPPKGADGKDLTAEEQAAAAAAEGDTKDPVVKATEGIRRDLVEERTQRRTLQQQLDAAQQVINDLQTALQGKPATEAVVDPLAPFKDFKELTNDEFKDLVATDYAEAQVYLKTLADYREAKRTVADQQQRQSTVAQVTQRHVATIINTSRDAMAKEVPGLYDANSDVSDKLIAFAEQNGMDGDLLAVLTDPATVLTERGGKSGKLMGGGAVAVLRFLNNLHKSTAATEARLREEITNELVTKFKIDTGVFKSIGDSPSVITTPDDTGQIITEDQYRQSSEEERRKSLGG